jgi:DNA-binding transcriptional MerR regulator
MSFKPTKLYYRIGEACKKIGVEAHVLRYWESEFPKLAPPKNKAGQRTYRPKDIELLMEIRKLLYEEGFTIAGARRQLSMESKSASAPTPEPVERKKRTRSKPKSGIPKERLKDVRKELENILTLLNRE